MVASCLQSQLPIPTVGLFQTSQPLYHNFQPFVPNLNHRKHHFCCCLSSLSRGRGSTIILDTAPAPCPSAHLIPATDLLLFPRNSAMLGYNIGVRLIDEFLAKSNISRCVDFKETAEVIAKVGFKMFLGVTATVTNWDVEGTSCSLVLDDNPLVEFVELPDTCQGLYYCNILSGIIRGALEMVSMKTEVTWVRDMLHGDDAYELRVKLIKQVPEEYPYKDED